MLITPDYCMLMARYNAWQNSGLRKIVEKMSAAELDKDRGAHFGSIRATLNHLLWADQLWLGRFADRPGPKGWIEDSVDLTPTISVWGAERFRTDGQITLWSEGLRAIDLTGDLTWHSKAAGREMSKPIQPLIMHFFNHQTHHRGQVHAMLTAAGQTPGVTDMFLMPET
ncbi:DinB family protein [Flavimaricola marinus]|uniref:DinB family protein n=1 Tax=Flavimaricola marinus TaxID=1819565 RepID=A0A238LIP7_9RHOB|nr:DinB family protein [Flavimaricola marinus]SMY09597.1 DinB family protein [Flavimaricola marinus]